MNLFMSALEKSFDEWFDAKYYWVEKNSPKYLSNYRDEVEKFSKFLLSQYIEFEESEAEKRMDAFVDSLDGEE